MRRFDLEGLRQSQFCSMLNNVPSQFNTVARSSTTSGCTEFLDYITANLHIVYGHHDQLGSPSPSPSPCPPPSPSLSLSLPLPLSLSRSLFFSLYRTYQHAGHEGYNLARNILTGMWTASRTTAYTGSNSVTSTRTQSLITIPALPQHTSHSPCMHLMKP